MSAKFKKIAAGTLLGLLCVVYAVTQRSVVHPTVSFLGKSAGQAAIVDDSLEPYFNQLQPMEMAAKTGSPFAGATLDEQRAECRKRYQGAVLDFTDDEIAAIRWHLAKLRPLLAKQYPRLGNTSWSFIKVADNIEGGLPHTRGGHIILSAGLCKQIIAIKRLPPERRGYLDIVELLAHEQVHVFQRTHPGLFDSLYSGLWGMQKAASIMGCDWLVTHHLANPDAVDCRWILPVGKNKPTAYLWPLVVFSEEASPKRMPDDFRMLAISLEKDGTGFRVLVDQKGKPVSVELLLVPEFNAVFPMSNNIYHPNEAAADIFAKLVIFDNFIAKADMPAAQRRQVETSLGPIRAWFKANLGNRSKR